MQRQTAYPRNPSSEVLWLASDRLSPAQGRKRAGGVSPLIEHAAPAIELPVTCQPVFGGRFHGIGGKEPATSKSVEKGDVLGRPVGFE